MPGHLRLRAADLAVLGGCVALGSILGAAVDAGATDFLVGGLGCLLLWWRHDRPVLVGLLTAGCDVLSFTGTPAYLVAVFAVAVRRPPWVVAGVAAAHLVAVVVGVMVDTSHDDPLWQVALYSGAVLGLVAASGLYVGARRALVDSLRVRATRLEADRERDVAAARAAERARIAGEVHDVLAHRISLISLHAGGLQVTSEQSAPRTAEVAGLIGATARSAMGDLRDVIGLLRETDGSGPDERPPPPQPTLDAVPGLVESSRQAGLPVELHVDLSDEDRLNCPASVGRHVYRVVQESLTNVHKHTARAVTTVRISGAPGDRLAVEVVNLLGSAEPHAPLDGQGPLPGSGSGLVGLHERITRAGGAFSARRATEPEADVFVVHAELAWP